MKNYFLLPLLLLFCHEVFSTSQTPDTLNYRNLRLVLSVGWGYPSPLQVYYYQANEKYPFRLTSTGNYRGHKAIWEIREDSLFLKEILVEIYPEDFLSSLPSINRHMPEDYNIRSLGRKYKYGSDVFANWFSGVIEACTDYYDIDDDEIRETDCYYFHVRYGIVVEKHYIDRGDYKIITDASFSAKRASSGLYEKFKMLVLYQNYLTYYFRLGGDDSIFYQNEYAMLEKGYKLSPLFKYYNNDHLNWPYNWENLKNVGAPECKWVIKDDSLFLEGLRILYGLRYDGAERNSIDLKEHFNLKDQEQRIFANWVTGVYLLQYGYIEKDDFSDYTYFVPDKFKLIRFVEGMLTNAVYIDKSPYWIDIDDIEDDIKRDLINDYYKK